MRKSLLILLAAITLGACGKYGPPLAPEALAPEQPQEMQVTADVDGVHFQWRASEDDRRGEELRSMDAYRVYRKRIVNRADIINEEIQFDLLTEIPDTHVQVLKDLREKAIEAGQISRRVKVEDTLTTFTYDDKTAEPGILYLYKIVPVNQGSVEGEVKQLVQILYRGDTSQIEYVKSSQFEEGVFAEETEE